MGVKGPFADSIIAAGPHPAVPGKMGVMLVQSLSDLQTANEFVRRLTPMGLSLSGMLTPERAAELQQQIISAAALTSAVPDGPRRAFERLRALHSYGVLCYEAYSAVCDLVPQTIELAVRERFISHFDGVLPIITSDGQPATAEVRTVGELVDQLQSSRSRLQPGIIEGFTGGFRQLLTWARRNDYLSGQRARIRERDLVNRRNRQAHPDYQGISMPNQSSREIYDAAEIINRLWGYATPGGRRYPASVRREPVVLAAHSDGSVSTGAADGLHANSASLRDSTVLVVQAWVEDRGLNSFDERFERTEVAADRLWGPGTIKDASQWLTSAPGAPDEVEVVDRWFVVLDRGADSVVLHRSVFAGLTGADRDGSWLVVMADNPSDARQHARSGHGPEMGDCELCAAHGKAYGSWSVAFEATDQLPPCPVDSVEVKHRMPGGMINLT
jgi:hypothetical protein